MLRYLLQEMRTDCAAHLGVGLALPPEGVPARPFAGVARALAKMPRAGRGEAVSLAAASEPLSACRPKHVSAHLGGEGMARSRGAHSDGSEALSCRVKCSARYLVLGTCGLVLGNAAGREFPAAVAAADQLRSPRLRELRRSS